jgi:predicted ATPase
MMPANDNTLIESLRRIRASGGFPKYIEYIRFPYFRSIRPGTQINFEFPVTVFVGKNGGGKSTALKALFGCPKGKSLGNYWFSTDVDHIVTPNPKSPHCFIYGYKGNDNTVKEVLKTRIQKKKDPDYWEPSRPIASYGMTVLKGQRNPAIEMEVLYMDFRAILSAFDKCFYFFDPPKSSKQDYLRKRSRYLKKSVAENKPLTLYGRTNWNSAPVLLSETEVKDASEILGKPYTRIEVVDHRFFSAWGSSVLLKTGYQDYSEAFAGSGETAAVMLVHKLNDVPEGALVLLDEPEVSLHPGAQKKLIHYILRKSRDRKLQVVISTHSPSIVEALPQESIKVFEEQADGAVIVNENVTPSEAFYSIGHTLSDKINVIVEDELAKMLLEEVMRSKGKGFASQFNVGYFSGGESNIKRNIVLFSNETNIKRFVVFDGDQKPSPGVVDPAALTEYQKTSTELRNLIKTQVRQDVSFYQNGGAAGGNEEQLIEQMLQYLRFYHSHVAFLPLATPDEIVWDEPLARELLTHAGLQEDAITAIIQIVDPKKRFAALCSAYNGGSAGEIRMLHKIFLRKWVTKHDENFAAVLRLVESIPEIF